MILTIPAFSGHDRVPGPSGSYLSILPSRPASSLLLRLGCFAGVIGSAAQVRRLYSMLVAALAGPASGMPIALKTAVRTPLNAGFISTTTLGRHGLFRTKLPKASGAAGMQGTVVGPPSSALLHHQKGSTLALEQLD